MNINYNQNPQNFNANYSVKLQNVLKKKYGQSPNEIKIIEAFENKIKDFGPKGSVLGIYKRNTPVGYECLTITLYKETRSTTKSTLAIRGDEMDKYVDIGTDEIDYIKLFKEYFNNLKLRKLEKGLYRNMS